jgi:hypothetical protein
MASLFAALFNKDPNFSSAGANGQREEPKKTGSKLFVSIGPEFLVTSSIASLKGPSKPLTESSS